jgi:hypothetical protein
MADRTIHELLGELGDIVCDRLGDIEGALRVLAHSIETADHVDQSAWWKTISVLQRDLAASLEAADETLTSARKLLAAAPEAIAAE